MCIADAAAPEPNASLTEEEEVVTPADSAMTAHIQSELSQRHAGDVRADSLGEVHKNNEYGVIHKNSE